MSDGNRSFWSSVPGLITGLAGLLTGIVGLGTLLVQQGVIGKDSKTPSTIAGAPLTTGTSVEPGSFTMSPTTLDFQPVDPKEKVVTLKNTSRSGTLTLSSATVTGADKDRFTVSYGTCTSSIAANLTCTLKVTFTPSGGLKKYNATLQVLASGAPQGAEVALTATTLL